MSKYVKVRNLGGFGHDYNEDVMNPGFYSIPIPNYDSENSDDDYEFIDVKIAKILDGPEARYQIIIGYDENGDSQMWYYNGAQRCFKRIWQDGVMGDPYKDAESVFQFLVDDADVEPEYAKTVAEWFMTL